MESVFAAGERILVFTHFAEWGRKLAAHLTEVTGTPIACYDGSLSRGARDRMVAEFQAGEGPGALVLSLKAGGTGLNLTAASHVVLYDRWWNPAVEDQARDRAWRIGQTRTVVSHRLVCPGTVDERVEEVVAGKRHIADLVLPAVQLAGRPQRRAAPASRSASARRAAHRGDVMSDAQSTNGRQSRNPALVRAQRPRRPRPRQLRPEDLWRTGLPLPDAEPITPGGRPDRAGPLPGRPAPARATGRRRGTTWPRWSSGPPCWPPRWPPAPTSSTEPADTNS